ncbi:MAG TPA: rhomboid family intramembrane serine protease [Acidobacteriaceae bacterium]
MSESNGRSSWGAEVNAPEILPPQQRPGVYAGQPASIGAEQPVAADFRPGFDRLPPARTPRPRWATAPATYVLIGINCLVFLLMCLSGASPTLPTRHQLLLWGADAGPLVLAGGQWWRLVTAMFVHIGALHLALNMWCLWNLGLLGEPLVGPLGLFAAYVLTGIGGNLLTVAISPGLPGTTPAGVGAGASGAIFGLAGLLIVLLRSRLLPLPKAELKGLQRSVIWFAVLNFVLGAGSSLAHTAVRIDNMAHLGGFITGLAMALPMVPKIGAAPSLFRRRRAMAIAGASVGLLLLAYGVHSFYHAALTQMQ